MAKQIAIHVSDELYETLTDYLERLPEIVARGLAAVQLSDQPAYLDATELIDLLAQQPSPRVLLNMQPSPALQERLTELLLLSQQDALSRQEALELERYLTIEHLVRLAKGHAYHRISESKAESRT